MKCFYKEEINCEMILNDSVKNLERACACACCEVFKETYPITTEISKTIKNIGDKYYVKREI